MSFFNSHLMRFLRRKPLQTRRNIEQSLRVGVTRAGIDAVLRCEIVRIGGRRWQITILIEAFDAGLYILAGDVGDYLKRRLFGDLDIPAANVKVSFALDPGATERVLRKNVPSEGIRRAVEGARRKVEPVAQEIVGPAYRKPKALGRLAKAAGGPESRDASADTKVTATAALSEVFAKEARNPRLLHTVATVPPSLPPVAAGFDLPSRKVVAPDAASIFKNSDVMHAILRGSRGVEVQEMSVALMEEFGVVANAFEHTQPMDRPAS
jgi:hypothetical protein